MDSCPLYRPLNIYIELKYTPQIDFSVKLESIGRKYWIITLRIRP